MAKQLDSGKVLCEQCGESFDLIGQHWTGSPDCFHPRINYTEREAIIGLLMSDGTIANKGHKNQSLQIAMINKKFLEWLDNKFGWLSTGVKLSKTAEENVKYAIDTGFAVGANIENYHDYWMLRTRSHPFINELTSWYREEGDKVWPENLYLTPTKILMLYIGDGTYSNADDQRYISIAAANERTNEDKINSYFNRIGIREPSFSSTKRTRHETCEYPDGRTMDMRWDVIGSYQLFKYMTQSPWWDGPPPGFEYKFPENFGGTGKSMLDLEN